MTSVITVSTGTVGAAGNVTADLQTYFSAQLLQVAERNMVLDQFGEKTPIPSNSSSTIQFVREEKFAVSTNPTALTEGVSPDAVGITLSEFQATAEQYGYLVILSDLAELTAKHPIVTRTVELLGQHAQETYDLLIFNVLAANSNVSFVGGGTAITQLTAANVMSYGFLVELAASLQDAAARPFDGGDYVCVVAPQVKASLLKDAEFLAAHQFNNTDAIYRGEFGAMAGLRVVQSNAPGFAATTQTTANAANLVYTGFAIGKSAYQIADLQNLKAYIVAPGGQADPLQQKRQMGYKFAFKSIITNTTWINTFFSAGNNSVNNA